MRIIEVRNNETGTSLCCKAAVNGIREASEWENEVSSINYCTACNSEAPKRYLFALSDSQVAQFFIQQNTHRSENKTEKRPFDETTEKPDMSGRPNYQPKDYRRQIRSNNK